ncbi:MAG TPA: LacI family DNA-binding transcriptional regulator [Ktedonobacteraceae bacterium]|nr:LacI family DNA-binding transcriptional regulator [Ktedonobacteraceae bacterium]
MANIRDVALKAEVSISTVSRVVNGNRPVGPEIRARVLQAVEELGYRPNYLARGLRQSNTCMIGMIITDNSNPFYAEMARAIEDAGFAAGYSVILCNSDLSDEKQQAYVNVLISHQVDGIILIDSKNEMPPTLKQIIAENIPVVVTNIEKPIPSVDQVIIDNYQGGYMAGKYLLNLNHRRIGCITLHPPGERQSARIYGFQDALRESGIELQLEDFEQGNGRYDSGYNAMLELLQRGLNHTAIFVFNDLMALGAINALHSQGLKVPDDISIIGYDDIFYASAFEPALTTVAQPVTAIGQQCFALLLERIQQPDKPYSCITLPVKLVERNTCRPLILSDIIEESSSVS